MELSDYSSCNDGFNWNPRTCKCECNTLCGFDEYLHYKECDCKKCVFHKLIEVCKEDETLSKTETISCIYKYIQTFLLILFC